MAVDDVYQLTLRATYAGQTILNGLAFKVKTETDPTSVQALALANDWKDHLRPMQATILAYQSFVLQQVRGGSANYTSKVCQRSGGARFEGNLTGTLTGSKSGDALPPQSAVVTTLRTSESGRTRRGRSYMAGLSETDQAYGTITSGIVTVFQTAWNVQLGKFGPTGTDALWQIGIWSMRLATGCVPRKEPPYGLTPKDSTSPGTAFQPVIEFIVKPIVYNQRRRTIGVGI